LQISQHLGLSENPHSVPGFSAGSQGRERANQEYHAGGLDLEKLTGGSISPDYS
jgi:hypothetical protein